MPRLRGVLHTYAFFASLVVGAGLIAVAHSGRARLAAVVYVAGLAGCLGTSAVYHRGRWSPPVRAWLGRADHSMIFVLIAATYTPVCLLGLSGALAGWLLFSVWAGALVGIVLSLAWWSPPVVVEVVPYLALGWAAVVIMPQLPASVGWTGLVLLVAGGLLYTVGAVIYGLERPNPRPLVFGYHEVFHTCTIAAAVSHLTVVGILLFRV
ncbi:MAG TPA: hemolysin III family protein [Candidatus Dormibacteraeota bacterium]|nr:hemolysin III family protein [Candidatus Dormibacteraeota bacterium]